MVNIGMPEVDDGFHSWGRVLGVGTGITEGVDGNMRSERLLGALCLHS